MSLRNLKAILLSRDALTAMVMALGIGIGATMGYFRKVEPAIAETVLLRGDVTDVASKEYAVILAELPAGMAADRHFQPGDEFLYVLEGMFDLMVEGKPTVTLKPGDAFHIDATKVHEVVNTSSAMGKVIAIGIYDKGKPPATPVKTGFNQRGFSSQVHH